MNIASRSKARLAQDNSDLSIALRYLDDAEKLVVPDTHDDLLFSTVFDQERYCIDRAATLMAPPNKRLRSPNTAEEYLVVAAQQRSINSTHTRYDRQAYSDLIQAKIYIDQGYYPVAATTAESVLVSLKKLQSKMFLGDIADLLRSIKTHHPHSIEVSSLEMELMRIQHPYLFG